MGNSFKAEVSFLERGLPDHDSTKGCREGADIPGLWGCRVPGKYPCSLNIFVENSKVIQATRWGMLISLFCLSRA